AIAPRTRRWVSTSTCKATTRCKARSCSTADAALAMTAGSLEPRRAFLALISGLIVVAWLTLFLWELSPHARYLDHGKWTELGVGAWLCRAVPAGSVVVPAALYALGWTLMISAMMLPTTLPLLVRFSRLTEQRADSGALLLLVIAGYLLVWLAF